MNRSCVALCAPCLVVLLAQASIAQAAQSMRAPVVRSTPLPSAVRAWSFGPTS